MTRFGLVIGAGGVVGQAYHSGVLSALEQHVGFDGRRADVLVGTSAGSITATLLRLGVSATDLAAWTLRAPLTDPHEVLAPHYAAPASPQFAPIRAADLLRKPSMPGSAMLRRALVRPWQFRPMAAALALLAPGRNDIAAQLSGLIALDAVPWPAQPLWIGAVRRCDGRRIVFGRPGAPDAPLHLAVAASCAVPGYFTPITIGEHSYVDGGAHSPTNAGLLRGAGLDVVLVISPMSGPVGRQMSLAATSRRHAARRLEHEVRALRKTGSRVIVFAPGQAEQDVMGEDMMSTTRPADVVEAARQATVRMLTARHVRAVLDQVSRTPADAPPAARAG
jgi:NTE family protein